MTAFPTGNLFKVLWKDSKFCGKVKDTKPSLYLVLCDLPTKLRSDNFRMNS